MIINYFGDNLTPEKWEEMCDTCYRYRYQGDHYQKIPATFDGDAGIEGYTLSGVVYQCYYPEKTYSDNEYYEHLRDKATKDINKLKDNIDKLKALGVSIIKEWHFVIPAYRDPRILRHLKIKQTEIQKAKQDDPEKYNIISDDFKIIVKIADDFVDEIYKYILYDIKSQKLKLDFVRAGNVDVSKCDSAKVLNIKRKIKAIMHCEEDDDIFLELVNSYIYSYMEGLELLNRLAKEWPVVYQEIYDLMEANKKRVYKQSRMNTDNSLNKNLFDEIIKNFEQSLKQINVLSEASITELSDDIIAGWLADCNLEFKV